MVTGLLAVPLPDEPPLLVPLVRVVTGCEAPLELEPLGFEAPEDEGAW
ncbi:MAG: hypothetical protein M3Y09_02905 [Actinomycetota bacterium]|nr:hypothetical protein [Actinomycetota bacterium]